jgi:hypothetical protein
LSFLSHNNSLTQPFSGMPRRQEATPISYKKEDG